MQCEVNHLPPSSAEVMSEWSYTSAPSVKPSWHGQGQLQPIHKITKAITSFFMF